MEWKPLAVIVAGFIASFCLPVGKPRFDDAVAESVPPEAIRLRNMLKIRLLTLGGY